jgi:hypothetical protein
MSESRICSFHILFSKEAIMAKATSTVSRAPETSGNSERSSRGPVFSCRHRALKAAVWRNETDNSGVMFNTTISRSYKTDGDQWAESQSFGWDDLLIVAELLRTCYGYIAREMSKQGPQPRE